MATVFEFTLASEDLFPNKKYDADSFAKEIRESSITVALSSILTVGGNCVVTFKSDLSASEETTLGTLVKAHTGAPLLSARQTVVPQPFASNNRNISMSGHRQVCDLNAVTDLDIAWSEEREVQGAEIAVKDFTEGDFVEATLRHPQAGQLVDFGKSYIKPDGKVALVAESAKTFPAGLVLRVAYTSTASTGSQPIMYVDVKTWK